MRLFAIGDIHGYAEPLRVLLRAISPTIGDKFVFLGDYVDKGPDVRGTIDLLLEFGSDNDAIFLRGNHDQLLLDAILDPDSVLMWETLAGENPLSSYGHGPNVEVLKMIPQAHIEFLSRECQNYHEAGKFIFVHGGIRSHHSPHEEDPGRLQWSTLSLASPHLSGRTVVCGHTSQENGEIVDLGHTICIDTGISKGKYLTCLNLVDFTYVQVSNDARVRSGRLRLVSQ